MKLDDCHNVPTLTTVGELLFLLGSALVSDCDIPSESLVDIVHHLTKDFAMRTCVLDTIEMDVIMYHLMDDSIFHFVFGQIKTSADTKTEIVWLKFAKECLSLLIDKHSEECLGIAELDSKKRELIIKDEMIKLPELLFDVVDCGFHVLLGVGC